jgi:hypothetical protein
MYDTAFNLCFHFQLVPLHLVAEQTIALLPWARRHGAQGNHQTSLLGRLLGRLLEVRQCRLPLSNPH